MVKEDKKDPEAIELDLSELGVKIKLMPVDKLDIADTNVRKTAESEDTLNSLAANIDKIGLRYPLYVTSKGKIYGGGRRFKAMEKLVTSGDGMIKKYLINGKYYIPVIVDDCSERQQIIHSLSENLHHVSTNANDVREAIFKLRDTKWEDLGRGMTRPEIAEALNLSEQTIEEYLATERIKDKEVAEQVVPIMKNTSVRRSNVIESIVETPLMKDEKQKTKSKAVSEALTKIPMDLADRYSMQVHRGLPVIDEIIQIGKHPELYKTLQTAVPMATWNKLWTFLETKKMSLMDLIVKAVEDYVERNK